MYQNDNRYTAHRRITSLAFVEFIETSGLKYQKKKCIKPTTTKFKTCGSDSTSERLFT